jgi:WD40 repeat protein
MLWDADKMEHSKTHYIGTPLTAARFNGAGTTLMVGAVDGKLRLMDAEKGKVLGKSSAEHTEKVNCLGEHGQILASGGADCVVKLWDARADLSRGATTSLEAPADSAMGPVRALCFVGGGSEVMCGDDGNSLKIFDIRRPDTPMRKLRNSQFAQEDAQCALLLTPNGTLIAGAAELADDDDVDDDDDGEKQGASGTGAPADSGYLADRLDGCLHIFTPQFGADCAGSTWDYHATLSDETKLISCVDMRQDQGAVLA